MNPEVDLAWIARIKADVEASIAAVDRHHVEGVLPEVERPLRA